VFPAACVCSLYNLVFRDCSFDTVSVLKLPRVSDNSLSAESAYHGLKNNTVKVITVSKVVKNRGKKNIHCVVN